MNQPNISLPYRSPGERARAATRRMAENSLLSLALLVCVALMGLLTTGDFSRAAWAALGISVAKSALDLLITFIRHLMAARADDAALSQ
jgi:hypothetical protein